MIALFRSVLAPQASARGLARENCGCFDVHLVQELRWRILLEDAEFLLPAALAARATGLHVAQLFRSRPRGAAGGPLEARG